MQIKADTRPAEGRQAVPARKMVIRNVKANVIRSYLNVSKIGAIISGLASAVAIA